MQNFIQPGNTLAVTLTAACNSGDVIVQGAIRGVAATNGAVADVIAVSVEGVFRLGKGAATVFAAGDKVGWDGAGNLAIAGGASGNLGYAAESAASGATSVNVRLCPGID